MSQIRLTSCTIDLDARTVQRGTEATPLTPREVDVLRVLVDQANQIVPKGDLVDAVWGHTSDKTLSVALRRLRTKLEVDPSQPRHLEMHRGVGVRLVVPDRPTVPGLLAPSTPLLGRDDERDALLALLRDGHRLITLLGPGGVGKTRLATAVAGAWSAEAPTRFFDLSPARTGEDLARILAVGLGAPGDGDDPLGRIGRILTAQREGPRLWVLDNVEQVAEACGACLVGWLPLAGTVRFLVTSRTALRIPGERPFRLAPLDDDAALALLCQGAPDLLGPDGTGRDAALALVRRVDGLPLALQLAAPVAGALGARGLLDRWDAIAPTLVGPPGRHESLDTVFRGSWDLLSAPDRDAAVALSTFRGPFDLARAEAILATDGALDVLQRLVGCSLLQVVARRSHGFRMLSLVRRAVDAHATPSQQWAGAAAHLDCIVVTVGALADRLAAGDPAAIEPLEGLIPEVEGALDHAVACGDADAALSLVNPLLAMIARRGHRRHYGDLIEIALGIDGGDPAARGEALYRLASVRIADPSRARPAAEAALALAQRLGLPDLEGRAWVRLGDALHQQGDQAEAAAAQRRAVAIYDADPTLPGWCLARFRHGIQLLRAGDDAGLDRILAQVPPRATPFDRAMIQSLAVARLAWGGHADAAEASAQALIAQCDRLEDVDGVGRQLNNLGSALMMRGCLRRSRPYLQRALANRRSLGLVAETSIVWVNLAALHLQGGSLAEADDALAQADAILEGRPEDRGRVMIDLAHAEALVRADRRAEALGAIAVLMATPSVHGYPRWLGMVKALQAMVLAAQGDSTAGTVAREATALLVGRSDVVPYLTARVVEARIAMDHGDRVGAAEMAHTVLSRAEALGHRAAAGRAAVLLGDLADGEAGRVWHERAAKDAEDPTVLALAQGGASVRDLGHGRSLELRWARPLRPS